jgi:hypothetical protein
MSHDQAAFGQQSSIGLGSNHPGPTSSLIAG